MTTPASKAAASKVTPSAQYAITIRLEYPHKPGWIARIATIIADQGGAIEAIDLVEINKGRSLRDYTVECGSAEQAQQVTAAVKAIEGVRVLFVTDDTFALHMGGKLEITSRVPLKTRNDLSMAYTPGVARVCMALHKNPALSLDLTIRKNCIAVVSDGSAVLGLGNIGPLGAMPVMEGKAILFKEFGGVDAVPLCVATQDPKKIIEFCRQIEPSFGGINLEDISAPNCFEIEQTLKRELKIPVFHDDQHGTAVVVLAAIINALKLTGQDPRKLKAVVCGAGAAGVTCSRTLREFGIGNIIVCDTRGAIYQGRDVGGNVAKQWLAENTNPSRERGSLKDVVAGADIFLGLSGPNLLGRADVEKMHAKPIIFAMSNPVPEVMPEECEGLVSVMATGRSDYPNQINNVLAFPGIFRGALDVRATDINEAMKQAAAKAIADIVAPQELSADYIIPSVFNRDVAARVAAAGAEAARQSGVIRPATNGVPTLG
jgi:malate dehydrogenase (oxaloacetate-decarboxylating)